MDKKVFLIEDVKKGWYKLSDSSISGIKVLGLKQFLREFLKDTNKYLVFEPIPDTSCDGMNYYKVTQLTNEYKKGKNSLNKFLGDR